MGNFSIKNRQRLRRLSCVILAAALFATVRCFTIITPRYDTIPALQATQRSGRTVSELSSLYAIALRKTLETLVHHRPDTPHSRFRRILIREHVGLAWSSVPEKYWEHEVLPRLRKQVNIIDIGANIGQFAIPNAELGHYVVSFEPNVNTCNTLKSRVVQKHLAGKVCLLSHIPTFVFFFISNFA